ncbi:unnamed protein product [Trichogramma brassicae]|uniref:Uncharacterized protein n=1 Tax=Trichogramma brassicae TaxID=86971 RepID=A0A6H5I754_9HYME|nr:unnamed protein product [Trichogramma brassicae]
MVEPYRHAETRNRREHVSMAPSSQMLVHRPEQHHASSKSIRQDATSARCYFGAAFGKMLFRDRVLHDDTSRPRSARCYFGALYDRVFCGYVYFHHVSRARVK